MCVWICTISCSDSLTASSFSQLSTVQRRQWKKTLWHKEEIDSGWERLWLMMRGLVGSRGGGGGSFIYSFPLPLWPCLSLSPQRWIIRRHTLFLSASHRFFKCHSSLSFLFLPPELFINPSAHTSLPCSSLSYFKAGKTFSHHCTASIQSISGRFHWSRYWISTLNTDTDH